MDTMTEVVEEWVEVDWLSRGRCILLHEPGKVSIDRSEKHRGLLVVSHIVFSFAIVAGVFTPRPYRWSSPDSPVRVLRRLPSAPSDMRMMVSRSNALSAGVLLIVSPTLFIISPIRCCSFRM